jgi:hypothetical protein
LTYFVNIEACRGCRERIVSLLSTNTSVVGITKSLNEEGIKASRSAVSLFICRFRKTEIHDVAFIIIDADTTAFKFSLSCYIIARVSILFVKTFYTVNILLLLVGKPRNQNAY